MNASSPKSETNGKVSRTPMLASAVATVMGLSGGVYAATYTAPTGSNTSTTADLWSNGTGWDVAPSSGSTTSLIFNAPTAGSVTRYTSNDLGNFVLNAMTLAGGNTSGSTTFHLAGNSLEFQANAGTAPVVYLNTTKGGSAYVVDIDASVVLTDSTTFQGTGTASFIFTGGISGNGGLTVAKTVILTGTSTYIGGTTINSGSTLQIGNAGSAGTLASGTVNDNGTLTFALTGSDVTVGNLITGTGGVTKAQSNRVILTNTSNSFTGAMTVSGGTLQAYDTTSYGPGDQAVTSTILGQGTSNAVSLSNTSALELRYNGQSDSSAQTLTVQMGRNSNLLLNSNGSFTVDVNRASGQGSNKTIAISAATIGNGSSLAVTGGNSYSLKVQSLNIGSTGGTGNATLNPTSANLILGTGTNAGTSYGHTLVLDGTASGNTIAALANNGTNGILSVTKQNSSTWTLTGNSTYTGATAVNGGKLLVNGSLAAGSAVTVGANGTLGGTGTIKGSVSSAGTIAPGAHQALNFAGNLILTGGSVAIDLASDSSYDSLGMAGSGNVDLGSGLATLNLTAASSYVPTANTTYWILNDAGTGTLSGTFANAANSGDTVATINGAEYKIYYGADYATSNPLAGTGNDIALTVTVPEPAAVALMGGLSVLSLSKRRRRA